MADLLSPFQKARLTRLVIENPGRTADEHEASAEKIAERLLIQSGMVHLVQLRMIRRDDHGRLWPVN